MCIPSFGLRPWKRATIRGISVCCSFHSCKYLGKGLTYYHSLVSVDSKTDSKTGRQQWISVDDSGNSIGFWSGWKTSMDGGRQEVPKGGLEPPCPYGHNALNVACLPISPLRLVHLSFWTGLYYCIFCDLSIAAGTASDLLCLSLKEACYNYGDILKQSGKTQAYVCFKQHLWNLVKSFFSFRVGDRYWHARATFPCARCN